jgi:hypothetical protein
MQIWYVVTTTFVDGRFGVGIKRFLCCSASSCFFGDFVCVSCFTLTSLNNRGLRERGFFVFFSHFTLGKPKTEKSKVAILKSEKSKVAYFFLSFRQASLLFKPTTILSPR